MTDAGRYGLNKLDHLRVALAMHSWYQQRHGMRESGCHAMLEMPTQLAILMEKMGWGRVVRDPRTTRAELELLYPGVQAAQLGFALLGMDVTIILPTTVTLPDDKKGNTT